MGSKRKRGAKEDASSASKRTKNAVPVAPKPNLENVPFVETPTIDERKREGAVYELLGSEDENDRIQAADCIVSGLLGGDGVSEPVLQRHLDRRLFRGLSSGRNASRLGFSLVITEILCQLFGKEGGDKYPGLTFDRVLGFLTEKAQVVGNVPGQEERDVFFGQLFGFECFVKSRTLFGESSRWDAILGELLRLGNKKVWLRAQCGWVLVQALEQMSAKQARATLERLAGAGMAKTPEGVAVWLVALERFPELKVKPWGNPLSAKSLGDLAAVLRESFNESNQDSGKSKQANWTAQLHFVWDIILRHYIITGKDEGDEFALFWGRVVDDGLFSKQATDGQKFRGFMVFQRMLEGLVGQPSKLGALFSKNLMTCLMNQAAKEDRYLNRAAIKALKAIEAIVSSHTTALPTVLDHLLGHNGAYNFDQRTCTKTIDKLLQNLNQENVEQTLEIIRRPIATLSEKEDDEAQGTLRVYIDHLSRIMGTSVSSKSGEASPLGFALQELSRLGYSQPKDVPPAALERVREFARARLETSLAKLTRQTDDFSAFCHAVASIDSNSVTMSDEIRSAIERALSRMSTFLAREEDDGVSRGLAMLHAISIFQLYNEDPDAMEVLDDLAQFHERLDEGAGSSEFLVEILLSMVSRPSSLLRQVSQRVFEAFTGRISPGGLDLLTAPLAASESTKGQRELFNTEEPDEEANSSSSSDGGSDVDMDSDVEFVGLKDDASADDDDDANSESEDEAEEEERGEAQDLDELVGQILNSHRLDKDADAASSDEEDMSDSEMLALDDKLADVFRQRVKARPDSKREKKDAKQSVINFKHRILDFIDIYLKQEVLNPLSFTLLLPLLSLVRTTSTRTLGSRACEIILTYQRGMKKARSSAAPITTTPPSAAKAEDGDEDASDEKEDEDEDEEKEDGLLAILAQVHDEAGKDNSHAFAKAASAASLILVSAMYAADKQSVRRAAAVYAKTQADWVLGEVRLQSSFFADWNNWCQNHASQARS